MFTHFLAHASDCSEHGEFAGFDDSDDLLAFDRRERIQEIFDGFAAFEIVHEILERNARADENWCAAHDFRVRMDYAFEFFQLHARYYNRAAAT